jgi:predicted MPP superfamily phosphohydrolase
MFFIFHIIVIFILTGIQFYFYWKLLKHAKLNSSPRWMRKTIHGAFFLFNAPLYLIVLFQWSVSHLPQWIVFTGLYPLYIWHFSFFVLFLLTCVWNLLKLSLTVARWGIGKLHHPKQPSLTRDMVKSDTEFNSQRRYFLKRGVVVAAGATITASAYGAFHHDDLEITHVRVPVTNLPDEFNGFTIALISDIHSSVFMMREKMERYAASVNGLHADLTAVTGDFVNSTVDEVYPFAEAFSTLTAPFGVYGVLGNHDYYTRQVEVVAKEVNNCGITLLRNEHVIITKGKSTLTFLGVDDVGNWRRAALLIDRSLDGKYDTTPKILMCHRPYFFEQAAEKNIDLTLSGHTHGGQIVLGKIGRDVLAPARIASPYVAGMYTKGNSQMYVSRGIGTVAVPIRINCPPEITKFTLVKNS